jgi:4-carboxymuconolactone decarboxylase
VPVSSADGTPVNGEDRRARGARVFEEVNGFPAPSTIDPLTEATIDHVFAEIWTRPGLSRKERRWIALSCAGASGATIAMKAHVTSALQSGDITIEELREFVLQFAVYQGFPKATALWVAVDDASKLRDL